MSILKKKAAGEAAANPGPADPMDEARAKVGKLSAVTAAAAFVAVGSLVAGAASISSAQGKVDEVYKDMTTVATAAADIQSGTVVTEKMISAMSIPSGYLPADSMSPEEARELVGTTAVVKIPSGDTLTRSTFTGNMNNSSLANKLSKGKVATTIAVTQQSDFAQSLLHHGDYVDLYYYIPWNKSSTAAKWGYKRAAFDRDDKADGIVDGKVKAKLASKVPVAALGSYLSANDMVTVNSSTGATTRASYSTVTVETDKATAEKIREVQDNKWTIWLTLSSTLDNGKGGK